MEVTKVNSIEVLKLIPSLTQRKLNVLKKRSGHFFMTSEKKINLLKLFLWLMEDRHGKVTSVTYKKKFKKRERGEIVEKILELIKEGYGIQEACSRNGLVRKTFWAWRKEDPALEEATRKAVIEGNESNIDIFEEKLKGGARRYPEDINYFQALKLWLQGNSPKYRTNITINKTLPVEDYQKLLDVVSGENAEEIESFKKTLKDV